jgi:serine/threonine protein kinase
MWPGCLIQAIDYLHEMRVKHRDLKTANILVMGGDILIADLKSPSISSIRRQQLPRPMLILLALKCRYWAPEIDPLMATPNTRRGRPVDIFALGCIFLEIAAVLLAPPGSRAKLIDFMEINGTSQFRKCPKKLLQWIWFLLANWLEYLIKYEAKEIASDDFMNHSAETCELVFFMLDSDPKLRITARQLTGPVSTVTDDLYYHASVKDKSCDNCRSRFEVNMSNLPLHSKFKATHDLVFPDRPQDALVSNSLPDWETAKKWLQSHMWW